MIHGKQEFLLLFTAPIERDGYSLAGEGYVYPFAFENRAEARAKVALWFGFSPDKTWLSQARAVGARVVHGSKRRPRAERFAEV